MTSASRAAARDRAARIASSTAVPAAGRVVRMAVASAARSAARSAASATAMSATIAVTAAVMSVVTIIAAATITRTTIDTSHKHVLSSRRTGISHRNVHRLTLQLLAILLQGLTSLVFVGVTNKTKTSVSTVMSISRNIDIYNLSILFEEVIQILLPKDLANQPQNVRSIVREIVDTNGEETVDVSRRTGVIHQIFFGEPQLTSLFILWTGLCLLTLLEPSR